VDVGDKWPTTGIGQYTDIGIKVEAGTDTDRDTDTFEQLVEMRSKMTSIRSDGRLGFVLIWLINRRERVWGWRL